MNRPRKTDRHLPDCVYRRHGAYWYVKKGQWKRLGSTLAEALEAYAGILETPVGQMDTVVDAAYKALCARKPPLSPNTLTQYKYAATRLKKMLAEFRPEQVKGKHAAAVKRGLAATPNMANRVLSFARQVFDYALEGELIESNPFVEIKRHSEAKRDRLLTQDEYERIYAQSGPRLQVIEDLWRTTGQRVNAVLRIALADLVEEGIRFPRFKTPTKRIVKWTPELRAIVERAKGLRGNVRSLVWLLPGRGGKPPNYRSVRDQFERACIAAGVENVQPRDLRAVAATEAKKQGKNPTALLGHTSEQQTQRYLRDKEEPVVEGPSFGQSIRQHEKS